MEITGQVPTDFSSSAEGDYVEHLAICWLYEQGYAVFRNCSCVGDVDMIATKGDDTIKIDVKSLHYAHTGRGYRTWKCSNGRTLNQKEQKVVYLLYHPIHKTFVFSEKTTEPKNQ